MIGATGRRISGRAIFQSPMLFVCAMATNFMGQATMLFLIQSRFDFEKIVKLLSFCYSNRSRVFYFKFVGILNKSGFYFFMITNFFVNFIIVPLSLHFKTYWSDEIHGNYDVIELQHYLLQITEEF